MWNLFSEQYHERVNIHVPKYTPKKGCKPKALWVNAESLNSIKHKRHARAHYRATRSPADFERYKRMRNQANEDIRTAKRNYERKIAKKAMKGEQAFLEIF